MTISFAVMRIYIPYSSLHSMRYWLFRSSWSEVQEGHLALPHKTVTIQCLNQPIYDYESH